ncbi:MAG: TrkA family potassium uptake protein [Chloroflexota bacterium]|nr:TrkA family potassium uptake protein [Chloroflexota bacterium]
MKKRICVIGMGRFGMGAARELYQAGHDVLVLDIDDDKIQSMLGATTYAVRTDATSEEALRQLGVNDYDVAILALGDDNVESSILIAMVLRSMEVPYIVARAANQLHGEALHRIGVGKVVYPEEESAQRLAHVDFNAGILDYMELLSNVGISKVRPMADMVRRTLEDAGLTGDSGDDSLTVVALRRGRRLILNPSREETIMPGDVLLVAGPSEQVAKVFTQDQINNQLATI